MQALTVIILAVTAGTLGYIVKVPTAPILEPAPVPSLEWVHLQKLILPLFENVCEDTTDPGISRLSGEDFMNNLTTEDFWDPEVITKYQNLRLNVGLIPKGEIFSEYNIEHINELKIMFDVMQNAKTFVAFYRVAAWSRQNSNCGLYVTLIYVALENRRDTEKLTLPPPYELLPNYFIRKDIIIQGSSLLAGEEFTPPEGVRDEGNAYTFDANYTANFYDNHESKLAYFREDIGLNSYFFLKMLKFAPWLQKNVNTNRYGEEMYHMIKQLVARYELERYANGLPELDDISWDSLSDAPYDPALVYSNGNEFIHRTSPVQLPENEDKALLHTIENNIATVASHMRDAKYNKTQILNHLMDILVTGERSYDMLARQLLGKSLSNNGQPTVFEHYMTSLRDPMLWKMYKKIVALVDNALKMLPPYMKTELYFPGVEVISLDIKKLMTNFDYFEFDVNEALKLGNGDTTFQVKVRQQRLNYKPFVMKLNISSLVTQKGLVKIYLGPKMMPGEFASKRNMFYVLDSFELNLKKGSNIITRTSSDMNMFSPDFTSLKTLRKNVEDAQFGLDSLPLNTVESQINFPIRLIIPKGTPEGLPLQLFVFVAPIMKMSIGGAYATPNLEFNPAVLSPLYPLDLVMENRILLDLPNAFVKEVTVTQKDSSSIKKSWNDKTNGFSSNPNKEPFDYKAKKQQYDKDNIHFNTNEVSYPDSYYHYNTEQNSNTFSETDPTKSLQYSYSINSKRPYDYKSEQSQYQKPDYLSKKVDYKALYQDKTTMATSTVENHTELSDIELSNEKQNANNIPEEYSTTDLYDQTDIMDNVNNDDIVIPLGVIHNLLKSSMSDYSSSQKDITGDTKYNRPKIVIPYLKKSTESPVDKGPKSKLVVINKDETNDKRVITPEPKSYNTESPVDKTTKLVIINKEEIDDEKGTTSKPKSEYIEEPVYYGGLTAEEIIQAYKELYLDDPKIKNNIRICPPPLPEI